MSTHNIPFKIQKKTILNYPKSARDGMFSFRFKNEFETAVVNKPSMFEPLKLYFFASNSRESHFGELVHFQRKQL